MSSSLDELTGYLARVRGDLTALIDATPHTAFERVPADGGWTGAGILQHLGKVEGSTSKLLEGLFAAAIAEGMPAEHDAASWLHSIDRYRITDRTRRIEAPGRVSPDPNAAFTSSWASLQAVRTRLLRAVASVDGRDLSVVSAPHPFAGPLNGYQWILFIGGHEERHLEQLRETVK